MKNFNEIIDFIEFLKKNHTENEMDTTKITDMMEDNYSTLDWLIDKNLLHLINTYYLLNSKIKLYLDKISYKTFDARKINNGSLNDSDSIDLDHMNIYLTTAQLCSEIITFIVMYNLTIKEYRKIKDKINCKVKKDNMDKLIVDLNNIMNNNEYIKWLLKNSPYFKSEDWLNIFLSP